MGIVNFSSQCVAICTGNAGKGQISLHLEDVLN